MEKFFRSFINVYCNFIQEILLQERKEFETDAHSRLPKLKYQYNVVWMDSLCYLTCHTPWCMNHQWKCRATHCLWTQRSCSDGPVLWQEISTCHANTSTSLMYWGDTLTCRLCHILILALLLLNLWFPLNYFFISRSEINLKTFPFCLPGSGLEITI